MLYRMLLLSLLVVSFIGCGGNVSPELAEQELLARAPSFIAPAERYRVEMAGLTNTEVGSVSFTGVGVRPDPNLTIDHLVLCIPHIRYQRAPFRIAEVGNATFTARVSAAMVGQLARVQGRIGSGNVRDVRIEFVRGQINVSAIVPVAGIDVSVATAGGVRVVDGVRLNYEPKELRVAGIGVPPLMKDTIANRVNPILDLSGLRFTPHIDNVRIDPTGLRVSGRAMLRDVR